ncbi:hypothetical protein U6B65_14065 [Oscillospiraceae bacterium MB08-C2-2]|nr:hypothetical protein U6B65_14065 [Oscillospiraceae bacterium MB08-C2-2]
MSCVLEELFFGNIVPNEKTFTRDAESNEAIQVISTNEDELAQLLKDKERSLFFDYANAQSELNSIIAIEYFEDGFRLGAKIMMEVMAYATD